MQMENDFYYVQFVMDSVPEQEMVWYYRFTARWLGRSSQCRVYQYSSSDPEQRQAFTNANCGRASERKCMASMQCGLYLYAGTDDFHWLRPIGLPVICDSELDFENL